jgi:hypothetical protein
MILTWIDATITCHGFLISIYVWAWKRYLRYLLATFIPWINFKVSIFWKKGKMTQPPKLQLFLVGRRHAWTCISWTILLQSQVSKEKARRCKRKVHITKPWQHTLCTLLSTFSWLGYGFKDGDRHCACQLFGSLIDSCCLARWERVYYVEVVISPCINHPSIRLCHDHCTYRKNHWQHCFSIAHLCLNYLCR